MGTVALAFFGLVFIIAMAVGPLAVLSAISHGCARTTRQGEGEPLRPVMRVTTSEAGHRADPLEAMEERKLQNRHE